MPSHPTIEDIVQGMDAQKQPLGNIEFRQADGALIAMIAVAVGPGAAELKGAYHALDERLKTDEKFNKRIEDWNDKRIIVSNVVPQSPEGKAN